MYNTLILNITQRHSYNQYYMSKSNVCHLNEQCSVIYYWFCQCPQMRTPFSLISIFGVEYSTIFVFTD